MVHSNTFWKLCVFRYFKFNQQKHAEEQVCGVLSGLSFDLLFLLEFLLSFVLDFLKDPVQPAQYICDHSNTL